MTNEITQFKYDQLDDSTADFLRTKESNMRPTRKSLQSIKTEKMKKDPYCWVCRIGVSEILELHHILPVKTEERIARVTQCCYARIVTPLRISLQQLGRKQFFLKRLV